MGRKQILVVEDNELNREILCAILKESYQVLQAENGQAALALLRRQGEEISLILLDVVMPKMDGYTLLDILRGDPVLSSIPVIVTTQSNSEEDEVTALSRGATDFVPKPYRPQVILHRVASLINLRENAAIVNLLQYDRLTGVYTREFFYRKLRERLDANPDKSYCIVCANVENFKLFNDTFGVREGDRLLRAIADILRKMAGKENFCGRFRADRFLFLQEADPRWLTGEGKELEPEVLNHKVTFRWGVYEITDRNVQVEQMCDRVLLAAHSIKGKYNQFLAVYDDALRAKLLREQAISDAMEPALANEEFLVYLQPKYSLKQGCIAGAEALVRWIHPQWGFMSPGEFIPLFEKNGFIPRLDRYMWDKVCRLLGRWKREGHPMIPISVNVSRADIFQQDLVKTLTGLTEKYGVEPKYLHLEITESAYVDNASRIVETLKELRQLAASGYREVVLSAISLPSYGLDTGTNLVELVEKCAQVEGIERIRLGSLDPDMLTPEFITRLAAVEKLCPQFHLSLQSGCTSTLRRMRRVYTAEQYAQVVDQIRATYGERPVSFTTDCICGFPGETQADFEESCAFLKKIGFLKVHVFPYSRRSGTPAYDFPAQVHEREKQARSREMNALAEEIRREVLAAHVGTEDEVLLETPLSETLFTGYTRLYIPVVVSAPGHKSGEIVHVRLGEYDGERVRAALC